MGKNLCPREGSTCIVPFDSYTGTLPLHHAASYRLRVHINTYMYTFLAD